VKQVTEYMKIPAAIQGEPEYVVKDLPVLLK
jgi:hypothetical protein